ncbi:conserved hypothetical protein [Uncinocarpus reesii 1704]|uniref:Uncharacterized protein n=1 Tax=Uncinocarpus reesii (strain UAMH 1704) TaxID=336963 RepID=C4JMG1_UNCRE|nr:uncharacterized protein UREG_04019 [Uncinocarpus reesii 1704]EEP79173.1 conserved hypothetical protein [Uncinocarpus reesii 1704]
MGPSQPFPPLLPDPEILPESEPFLHQQSTSNDLTEDGEEEEEDEDDIAFGEDVDFRSHYKSPPAFDELDEQHVSSLNDDDDDDDGEEEDDDDEEEDEDADGNDGIALHRPFFQSTGSLPNAFAPPFYNRPPTPLPPSPSLTSLLRPSFSANTSRPTTPDSSDAETPNDTEAAVAKSARIATTVPRVSPKVPTYEYYGFVLYLASSLAFCA